jgi:hypothetical protein
MRCCHTVVPDEKIIEPEVLKTTGGFSKYSLQNLKYTISAGILHLLCTLFNYSLTEPVSCQTK